MTSNNSKIVVTGGGSGGHITTALDTIETLKHLYPGTGDRIVYVGGSLAMEGEKEKESLEEKLCWEKKIKFVKIRSGKLQRRFSWRSLLLLTGVLGGIWDAWKYLSREDVSVVFSTGGYVTVPVCFVAWLKTIPVIIHEQTTRVGLANKISSFFAKKILLGFNSASRYFNVKKVRFVGNPVRDIFLNPWKPEYVPHKIKERLDSFKENSSKYPVILIYGGSQGSNIINKTVQIALKSLLSRYQLIVITGDNLVYKDFDRLNREIQKLSNENQSRIITTKYARSEFGAYLDTADLCCARSGALFISELGVTKTPALLIPIPWVTKNEQYHNAKVLVDLGLAEILPQGELSPEILVRRIGKMMEKIENHTIDPGKVDVSKLFVEDAAKRIVKEIVPFIDL